MSVLEYAPRAFGGGPLRGDNVTKFVHMDEAGISQSEPICAQAAVIVDADKQWKKVEARLAELLTELVPLEHRFGFVFHAKDIFHGTDKYFSRERFPNPEDRAKIVSRVASIAKEFRLPVVVGYLVKSDHPWMVALGETSRGVSAEYQSWAFKMCAMGVEKWMRDKALEDEVAMLIVENNNQSKAAISGFFKLDSFAGKMGEIPQFRKLLRFQRIVEMPSFQEKSDSSLLQIADACAFAFTRFMKLGSQSGILSQAVDFIAYRLPPNEAH